MNSSDRVSLLEKYQNGPGLLSEMLEQIKRNHQQWLASK